MANEISTVYAYDSTEKKNASVDIYAKGISISDNTTNDGWVYPLIYTETIIMPPGSGDIYIENSIEKSNALKFNPKTNLSKIPNIKLTTGSAYQGGAIACGNAAGAKYDSIVIGDNSYASYNSLIVGSNNAIDSAPHFNTFSSTIPEWTHKGIGEGWKCNAVILGSNNYYYGKVDNNSSLKFGAEYYPAPVLLGNNDNGWDSVGTFNKHDVGFLGIGNNVSLGTKGCTVWGNIYKAIIQDFKWGLSFSYKKTISPITNSPCGLLFAIKGIGKIVSTYFKVDEYTDDPKKQYTDIPKTNPLYNEIYNPNCGNGNVLITESGVIKSSVNYNTVKNITEGPGINYKETNPIAVCRPKSYFNGSTLILF